MNRQRVLTRSWRYEKPGEWPEPDKQSRADHNQQQLTPRSIHPERLAFPALLSWLESISLSGLSQVANEATAVPSIFVIAGPNGAGKSTAAPTLLREEFKVPIYVNADTIAAGLSAFDPESAAFQAGRIMLAQLSHLRQSGKSFAFETTLATRGYAPWLQQSQKEGYQVFLLFLALHSPEIAVQRVALRVGSGGHNIPEDTIRRRYQRGLRNFFQLYRPICDEWIFADNAGDFPRILAEGGRSLPTLTNSKLYLKFEEQYGIPKI